VTFAVSDAVSQVLSTALDGLTERQNVIANDIANVDTPGFRSSSVDFEDSLKAAIADGGYDDGRTPDVSITTTPDEDPVGANGNNVNLSQELMSATQTQYSYQMLSRAMNDHLTLLQTAAQEVR
jgi:flagellar basal-body rod protein FlgB